MSADERLLHGWRDKDERRRLVEQLCAAERRARVAEMKVRALQSEVDGVTELAARVVELEDIVERLNRKIARRAS